MANVFVSYSRDSAETVKSLIEDIEALGHEVWFDQELSGGQSWWDKILDTIRQTDVFVVAVDQSSLKSKACISEFEYAHALGVPVLPVVTDGSVSTNLLPRVLQLVQHVPYVDADKAAAIKLARAFTNLPAKGALPKRLPDPPPAPMSYISEIAEKIATENVLNFEQQSALVIELKGGLSDVETEGDAKSLLVKLKERKDLLATIANEIDDILKPAESQDPPRPENEKNVRQTSFDDMIEAISKPKPGISQKVQSEELAEGLAESATAFLNIEKFDESRTWKNRFKSAGIGAVIGVIWGGLTYYLNLDEFKYDGIFVVIAVYTIPFMIAGFLISMQRSDAVFALVTLVTGFIILKLTITSDPIPALIYGPLGGVLIGGILSEARYQLFKRLK